MIMSHLRRRPAPLFHDGRNLICRKLQYLALPKTVQLGQVAPRLPGQLIDPGGTLGLEPAFQRFTGVQKLRFEVAVRSLGIHPGLRHYAARLFPRKGKPSGVCFFGVD
jgi:hypothetical protein